MKATDLMIGDWVMHNTYPERIKLIGNTMVKVYNSDNTIDIDELCPIPLTAEIMEKNFPKPRGEYWADGDFPIIGYSIPCISDGYRPYVEVSIYDPARVMEFEMYFHYVHELQHILRLCGIEKDIEL